MYCKKCSSKLKDGAKFCSNCGSKVEEELIDNKEEEKKEEETIFCRNCGVEIPKSSNVCPECGYKLVTNNVTNTTNNTVSSNDGVENFLVIAVSFLIPIVGIVLWAALRNDNPKRAKNALIAALVSIVIAVLLVFLVMLFVITYAVSSSGGM